MHEIPRAHSRERESRAHGHVKSRDADYLGGANGRLGPCRSTYAAPLQSHLVLGQVMH